MSYEFEFEVHIAQENTATNVHKVLYLLVSRGCKYNSGKYPGKYLFLPQGTPEYDSFRESDPSNVGVERLPEIVHEYSQYDMDSTSLTVLLHDGTEGSIEYSITVRPHSPNHTVLEIHSDTADLGTSSDYLRLVEHVDTLCSSFDVLYAGFVTEHDTIGSRPWDDGITRESVRRVTYYPSDVVDDFGRQRIRSIPAYRIHEHDDGGVFIIVEPDPLGDQERHDRAREFVSE